MPDEQPPSPVIDRPSPSCLRCSMELRASTWQAERKLLKPAEHEAPDPTELSLREAFALLHPRLRPPFSLRTPSPADYHQLVRAIAFGALTSASSAVRTHLVHLHTLVSDGYELFTHTLLRLSLDTFPRLLPAVRARLLRLTSELIGSAAVGVDLLVVSLLRWVMVGDFSRGNLWLAEELLGVITGHWEWLLEEPSVLASSLFLYLRLLSDHYSLASDDKLEALKRAETAFCIKVLRQHFDLCMGMGRDLVRRLKDVAFIPEFEQVWKDLLFEPQAFGVSEYSNVSQLYRTRTPMQYYLVGITPEMETRIRFLLTRVKWGSQRRYQEWFSKKFLCSAERETVVVDLIRFICCAHHPPNEIIRSNIIPRWALIGWLLKSCRKDYLAANAKLALFYDWLFFDEKFDNIMNIEPAILLMVHSIPEYVDLTQALIEFLFLLVDNYDIDRKNLIAQGVLRSFNMLVKKGVVQSLDPLTTCSMISPLLRKRINSFVCGSKLEAFNASCTARDASSVGGGLKQSSHNGMTGFGVVKGLVNSLRTAVTQKGGEGFEILESLLGTLSTLNNQDLNKEASGKSTIIEATAFQITEAFKLVGYDMFSPLDSLQHDDEIQSATAIVLRFYTCCHHNIMMELISFWSIKGCPVGARMLSYASRLGEEVKTWEWRRRNKIVETNSSENSILHWQMNGYVSSGIHGIEDFTDPKLMKDLVEGAFTAYGNFLRFSTSVCSDNRNKEDFSKCISSEIPNVANEPLSMLMLCDVSSCCKWNIKCIRSVFCGIFSHFSSLSVGRELYIQLLVEQLDHADLVLMQFEVSLKVFSVFGEDLGRIINLVRRSDGWELGKQQKFWGLLISELTVSNIKIEKLLQGISTNLVELQMHSISVEGLYTLLRCCLPTTDIIGGVISLPAVFQDFAAAVLASWISSNNALFFKGLSEWLEKHEKSDSVSMLLSRVPGMG